MKRKTSTVPTKIWSFGALEPLENGDLLREQIFQANRYYNTLIEIERKRRARFRQARAEAVPELGALEERYRVLDEQFEREAKALPKDPSKKKPQLTAALLALKEERKACSARMKELRAEFSSKSKSALEHIDKEAGDAVKAAREATPLYWGSYLLIENQVDQARKSKLDPRFRRFTGSGRAGVQLQGGLTLSELLSATDTRLQLLQPTRLMPKTSRRSGTRGGPEGWRVRIRIGSNGRAPIWATLPVVMHRSLPPDAVIKWAWIKVSDRGWFSVRDQRQHSRYELQIVFESRTFEKHTPGEGVAAVNFGWRANTDGTKRVAYLVDDTGHEEAVVMPASTESRIEKADALRSARDLHFEDAKRATLAFRALHGAPDWLEELLQGISHWRNPRRLERVAQRLLHEHRGDVLSAARQWKQERLAAGQDLFAPAVDVLAWYQKSNLEALGLYLHLWWLKNRHLRHWELSLRQHATGHRNDAFRRWVRQVADRYATICIEEFDLRVFAKEPAVGEEPRSSGFRASRAVAAPGELRRVLREAAGPKLVERPGHHNTVRCYECGHVNGRALTHRMTCASCGIEWDQDANNCRNQLREQRGGEPDSGGARRGPAAPQSQMKSNSVQRHTLAPTARSA